ncbi:MarR family transcriptional regulator [Brevibacillus sp. M2.1A]|uniref:MarR family winged helix-turn-helix transcriptional regulator n=1 Tax=Brevibacillus TaxID=55080 RepID=UPI00156BC9B3|nr:MULTISPECIES: MarR family transcriptional regulator [Brevibacillus]MBY0087446.1 MarR family transcriptional regulator [Brevibacillus brevis]MCC8436494.1 MarR family transcriptional regulator [Brevibacillus sp. M2.1A]MCE0448488.1 MarR family transcriptional regulator [Brevibacillus sp. AF8]UKK98690.1 MarR family transcriptional regulator [Brevibacillus brevis]
MEELIKLAKLIRGVNVLFSNIAQKELETNEINWQQVLILEILENGPRTMGDISKAVNLSNSTTSGLISRLEEENLVRRYRDQTDRRIVWVSLTERLYSA